MVGRLEKVTSLAIALVLSSAPALAAGGAIQLITDNTADGYYYWLTGTGRDRYIGEYPAGSIALGSVTCGARIRALDQGNPPIPKLDGDVRAEDPANPGYPDL